MVNKSWLNDVCVNLTWFKKRKKKNNVGYLPIVLFFIAGKFSNQQIDEIINYGDIFIEKLNY